MVCGGMVILIVMRKVGFKQRFFSVFTRGENLFFTQRDVRITCHHVIVHLKITEKKIYKKITFIIFIYTRTTYEVLRIYAYIIIFYEP